MNNVPTVERELLALHLDEYLKSARIPDYCPNGLQVEGRSSISHLIAGVTASQAFIERAVAAGADAILVHHGLFWKGDSPTLNGFRRRRLATVLAHDLNVFAYHLPLDVHPVVGNNVQMGLQMGWTVERTLGDNGLVCLAHLPEPLSVAALITRLHAVFGRAPECVGTLDRQVQTVAWCTGGAAGYTEMAALAGADAYLTGELSEPAVHVANESNMVLIGCGHHATERGGPRALGDYVAGRFGICVEFIDCFVSV
jgi:dinuclear metal center YbgI/SA1388 family protein